MEEDEGIWIYGRSDDLIEVNGEQSQEFYACYPAEDGTLLKIPELGITVEVAYDMESIWRVSAHEHDGINKGPPPLAHYEPGDHPYTTYSEALHIATDETVSIEPL